MAEVEALSEVMASGGPHVLCVYGTFSPDGAKAVKADEGKGGEAGERKDGGGPEHPVVVTYFHVRCKEDRRRVAVGGQEQWDEFVFGLEEDVGVEVCTGWCRCLCEMWGWQRMRGGGRR